MAMNVSSRKCEKDERMRKCEKDEYFEQLITLTTDVQNRSGLPQDSELLTGCK